MQVANVCSYKLGLKNEFQFVVQTRLVFAWTVTYSHALTTILHLLTTRMSKQLQPGFLCD